MRVVPTGWMPTRRPLGSWMPRGGSGTTEPTRSATTDGGGALEAGAFEGAAAGGAASPTAQPATPATATTVASAARDLSGLSGW